MKTCYLFILLFDLSLAGLKQQQSGILTGVGVCSHRSVTGEYWCLRVTCHRLRCVITVFRWLTTQSHTFLGHWCQAERSGFFLSPLNCQKAFSALSTAKYVLPGKGFIEFRQILCNACMQQPEVIGTPAVQLLSDELSVVGITGCMYLYKVRLPLTTWPGAPIGLVSGRKTKGAHGKKRTSGNCL